MSQWLDRKASKAFASPSTMTAQRFPNRNTPPRSLSPDAQSVSSQISRRTPSIIASAEDAEIFEQLQASTVVRVSKRDVANHDDDQSMSRHAHSNAESGTTKKSHLDLRNNDNSFLVLANLMIGFFSGKVDHSRGVLVLLPGDRQHVERFLPGPVRSGFLEAVVDRLKRTPEIAQTPLHAVTLKCRQLGFDEEGPELNPILAAISMRGNTPISIPVLGAFSLSHDEDDHTGNYSPSPTQSNVPGTEGNTPIASNPATGTFPVLKDDDMIGDDCQPSLSQEGKADEDENSTVREYQLSVAPNDSTLGMRAKVTTSICVEDMDRIADIRSDEEEEDLCANRTDDKDDADALQTEYKHEKDTEDFGQDKSSDAAEDNGGQQDFAKAERKEKSENTRESHFSGGPPTTSFENRDWEYGEKKEEVSTEAHILDANKPSQASIGPNIVQSLVSKPEQKESGKIESTLHDLPMVHQITTGRTVQQSSPAEHLATDLPRAESLTSKKTESVPKLGGSTYSAQLFVTAPTYSIAENGAIEENESLAKQQLQLIAEIREASNFMAESVTPETAKFWRDHVLHLQGKLRALHGEASNSPLGGGTGGWLPTVADDISERNRRFALDYSQPLSSNVKLNDAPGDMVFAASRALESECKETDQIRAPSQSEQNGVHQDGAIPSLPIQPHLQIACSPSQQPPLQISKPDASTSQTMSEIPNLQGTPEGASQQQHEYEAPIVDVVAPADLPGGYHFEAEIEGRRFLATVPPCGVQEGETFSCYMRELDSVAIDIPVGYWKDDLTGVCSYGCCHSIVWSPLVCPLIALSQIQHRIGLDFLGRPRVNNMSLSNRSMMLTIMTFWLFVNIGLFGGYNLKWSRGVELTVADWAALALVNGAMIAFVVFVTQSTRSSLRDRFLIREECCHDLEDLSVSALCLPCTVSQMMRHTANYDDYEAVCCSKTGLPNGVRVNQMGVKATNSYVI